MKSENIANQIRTACNNASLTLAELAAACGMSTERLCQNMHTGKFTQSQIEKMFAVLSYDLKFPANEGM